MQGRRDFIKNTMAAGAGLAVYGAFRPGRAWAFAQSTQTPLWKTDFRGVGPNGIPVAAPDAAAAPVTGVTHFTINVGQFQDQLLPPGGPATTLWGYNPANPLGGGVQSQKHLGAIIVAQKDQPIQITFNNGLPSTSIMPVDITIPGANQARNRTATHLHGGFVPWISDGGPHDWFAPNGDVGLSFLNNTVLNPTASAGQAEYYYPNHQSARLMWYHDHAWGITRTNAYAGIASAYVLRDNFEAGLQAQGLPPFIEASVLGGTTVLELPIVVQDKIFVGPNTWASKTATDPTWPLVSGATADGSLWYAHIYDTARYGKLGPTPGGPPGDPSCVPEFFGDTMLANGTVYPQVTVEARRYRFRILNACNARFLNLQLYVDDGTPNGITLNNMGNPTNVAVLNSAALNPAGKPTANWFVIGTEGGFLPNPVFVASNIPFNGTPTAGSLLLAPAERVDVLFDFTGYAGKNLILYTDTPAPFPGGDPRNDYFPGLNTNKNPVNAVTAPGNGPNTREIMRFKVVAATGTDSKLTITKATNLRAGNDPLPVPAGVTALPPGVPVRPLTLNETFDEHGRLIQMLGTNTPNALPGSFFAGQFGREYKDAPTETPLAGATEVWQITNLTADTHPIHFHLANVQIISRQPFNGNFTGIPNLTGAPVPPLPYEAGWKETVRMNPGEVINVIMTFNLPTILGKDPVTGKLFTMNNGTIVAGLPPPSPRTGGQEYVWHCHILEHEEHDMMRPLVVK
ncbi:MAG TPA: multicopper oxidase domain-containing protein [Usitatibacter sp.]|nr:multicopper oxidase domain-containing protein [Usitatibacter sp.]